MNIRDSLELAELRECQMRLERFIGELRVSFEPPAKELTTLQAAADHIDLKISELLQRKH